MVSIGSVPTLLLSVSAGRVDMVVEQIQNFTGCAFTSPAKSRPLPQKLMPPAIFRVTNFENGHFPLLLLVACTSYQPYMVAPCSYWSVFRYCTGPIFERGFVIASRRKWKKQLQCVIGKLVVLYSHTFLKAIAVHSGWSILLLSCANNYIGKELFWNWEKKTK